MITNDLFEWKFVITFILKFGMGIFFPLRRNFALCRSVIIPQFLRALFRYLGEVTGYMPAAQYIFLSSAPCMNRTDLNLARVLNLLFPESSDLFRRYLNKFTLNAESSPRILTGTSERRGRMTPPLLLSFILGAYCVYYYCINAASLFLHDKRRINW